MLRCNDCSRDIERGNYLNGVILCAKCASLQAEDEQLPHPKNLEPTWSRFTRQKRHRHSWR